MRQRSLRCNHELSRIVSPRRHSFTTYSTSGLVQTLKYDWCKFAFKKKKKIIFKTDLCFFFFSHSELMLKNKIKTPKWMNETRKRKTLQKKKSVHITLLALLLIQVFVFIILYYSDMFMILSSGKHWCWIQRVRSWCQGRGRGGKGKGVGGWGVRLKWKTEI